MLGALILQQTFDLADKETVQQYAFNIQWHYSLNISEETDNAKYISLKTLWNNRNIVAQNNLEEDIFTAGTNELAQVFKVNIDKQRIDSVHIKSNMRRLGRKGYQVQVMETYRDDPDKKEKSLNLITHVEVEPSHSSDANALIPAIESTKEQNLKPKEILADSLYGSDDNCERAKEHNFILYFANMKRRPYSREVTDAFNAGLSESNELCQVVKEWKASNQLDYI